MALIRQLLLAMSDVESWTAWNHPTLKPRMQAVADELARDSGKTNDLLARLSDEDALYSLAHMSAFEMTRVLRGVSPETWRRIAAIKPDEDSVAWSHKDIVIHRLITLARSHLFSELAARP